VNGSVRGGGRARDNTIGEDTGARSGGGGGAPVSGIVGGVGVRRCDTIILHTVRATLFTIESNVACQCPPRDRSKII
jgi:hypothetical protein